MKILAIDYGSKRIGYAISDETESIAFPHSVAEVHDEESSIKATQDVVRLTEAKKIIVGIPINMNGTSGEMVQKVMAFVDKIKEMTGIDVETYDERMSTQIAEKTLLQGDMSRSKRKKVRDKLSAQIVLQNYLDLKAIKNETN